MLESLARSARSALDTLLPPSNGRRDDDRRDDDSPPSRSGRSILGTTLAALALGALVANSVVSVRRTNRRRQAARPRALPERLQTWEGEGGRPHPEPDHHDDASTSLAPPAAVDVGHA